MNRGLFIFTAVLGGFFYYLGQRDLFGVWEWALLALPFFLVWEIPVILWSLERELPGGLETKLYQAGFVSAGFLSFLLIVTLIRDVILLLGLSLGQQAWVWNSPFAAQGVIALSAGLTVLGVIRAIYPPQVREVEVRLEGLSPSFGELRIVQITDLHVGPTIRRSFVETVVDRALSVHPDLIVLTGDLVDGTVEGLRSEVEPLTRLKAPLGVFSIIGNHETYWDSQGWIAEQRRMGFTVLENHGERVERAAGSLYLGGVLDPATGKRDVLASFKSGGPKAEDLKILLAHQPSASVDAAKAGFQLQLSGHTHAGQFFPWTWVARFFHRHFLGLSREGAMQVYVSPGTGSWGPPLRLGSRHEISVLKISSV